MKIAIVAPSSVPFAIGGAENLWWGLLSHINQHTQHQAELIKLPSPDTTFWQLIDSYRRFSQLDLSHFDLVISTKYPAWMIQHPNHVCYLQHRLRGLYDTYHFSGKPLSYDPEHPALLELQQFMRRGGRGRSDLAPFFERLDRLRACADLPQDACDFPGPLAREIVHFLDGVALSPGAIRHFAAISQNVKQRPGYFPLGSPVEVIYHPSNLASFREAGSDYIFTVSRLDGPKRIDLLIKAMRQVRADVELRIAGTGPEAPRLRELADGDPRVNFLGFVNDDEVIGQYANALFVPYIPYDEDYGLVTVEAMMSAKPVLTVADAGGPNEFVRNGQTGFSVAPTAEALAERIDYLCAHPAEAREMGRRGQNMVRSITWENTVRKLLALAERPQAAHARPAAARRKLTVALTHPVYPPRGGGQSRAYHLYRQLAAELDVDLVTLANHDEPPFDAEIAPHLREIRVPKSAEHHRAEAEISREVDWLPVTDVAMSRLYRHTPAYLQALQRSAGSADILVASHPYVLPALRHVSDKPLWFEAVDVDFEQKKQMLPDSPGGRALLQSVWLVEKQACEVSELIMTCSDQDAASLRRIYQVDPAKLHVVPNGFDHGKIVYSSLRQRADAKRLMQLEASFTALFVGSWHEPNIRAIREIVKFAGELKEINFLIVGSAGLAFGGQAVPPNVGFMGVVEEHLMDVVLGVADVALNPVVSGSGTNLKMLDYCAAGVPVLSTPFGVRGLGLRDKEHVELAELDDFARALQSIEQTWHTLGPRVERARNYVAHRFSWEAIAREFLAAVSGPAGHLPAPLGV